MKSNILTKILLLICAFLCTFNFSTKAEKHLCVMQGSTILFETLAKNVDSIAFINNKRIVRIYDTTGTAIYSTMRSSIDSIVFHNYESDPKLNMTSAHDMNINYNSTTEAYTLTTTGGDPFVYTAAFTKDLPTDSCVLTFDYICSQGVGDIQVFFASPISEARSKHIGSLPATGSSWTNFSYNIKNLRENFTWGTIGNFLRLDFGYNSDVTIQIRNFHFRAMTTEEKRAQEIADSITAVKAKIAADISTYLNTTYSSTVDSVKITTDQVNIKGSCSGDGPFALVEITPYEDVTEINKFPYRTELSDKIFSINLNRIISREGIQYDRALSKWAIVKIIGDKDSLTSHARYADSVSAIYSATPGILKGKKGIGAGLGSIYIADFDSLQIHSITMNVILSSIISYTSGSGFTTPYDYGGKTYYINSSTIGSIDYMTEEAAKRGIIVSAILLTPTGSLFNDPENAGGYYTMPNMTTAQSVNIYAAVLNYLAQRYSTGTYGRIHHWIMHNEVDAGIDWTNMGEQPEMRFYDRYIKSMRLCYNIVRQYDQSAFILGSYTHNWNLSGNDYSPKLMLEQNIQYSTTEGDFMWGIAYHPYPIDLTNPKFWINDKNQATFTKNSTYVTFYNPEVINDWILNTSHFYKNTKKRILFFSEQGTNSPSYSASDLSLQAAGAAWIWKKVSKLSGVDAIQWHNWKDNVAEQGLRIGLRSYADGTFADYDPKPAWYAWQAAGTSKEDAVFAPYLGVIGITSWDNIIQTVQ